MRPSDSVGSGLLSTKRDDRWRRFQNRIESGYEQHCLGTPNSGRSYARRAHASGPCPRSWMSPSVGSILGEQRDQSPDQCRLYARLHRTGASSTGRNSVFDTDTRSPIALVEMLFASEGKIRLQLPLRGKSNCNLPLRGKSRMLFFVKHRDAKRYNYLLSCSKRYLGSGRPIEFLLGWPYTRALPYAARKGNIQVSQPKAKNASTE